MIVVDASALADVLLSTARGRALTGLLRKQRDGIHAPSLIDAEVTSAVRRAELHGELPSGHASGALSDLAGIGVVRHPYRPLLPRAWELRHNFTVYDALYVALAEVMSAPLLTSDGSLADAIPRHTDVLLAVSPGQGPTGPR